MESRLANLEGAYQQIADRLNGMDMRLDGLDRKIDAFRESVTSEFRSLRGEMDRRFMWVFGMILTTWLTTWLTIILAVLFHR